MLAVYTGTCMSSRRLHSLPLALLLISCEADSGQQCSRRAQAGLAVGARAGSAGPAVGARMGDDDADVNAEGALQFDTCVYRSNSFKWPSRAVALWPLLLSPRLRVL